MALDNLFLIASKQLRQSDFSGAILGVLQGNFNTLLESYIQNVGFFGSNVVYATGGDQTVNGNKTFLSNALVNYSGQTGSAPSQVFVTDQIAGTQTQINTINLSIVSGAHLTGTERLVGQKIFEKITINSGLVTGELIVPMPVYSGDAVPLIYLQNQISTLLSQNLLTTTGLNQMASGIITFFNGGTILVPLATNLSGAVPLAQLDSTGNNILNQLIQSGNNLQSQINSLDLSAAASVTGFGGVLSFNGQSGNIFTQGRGGVTCVQNGNVLNVSGNNYISYTGGFFGYSGLANGASQQFISYGVNYSTIPVVMGILDNPSGDPFLNLNISGRTTSGFNVILSNSTTTSNYGVIYFGATGTGNIINMVVGPQGAPSLIPGNPFNINYYSTSPVTGSGIYEYSLPQNFTMTGWNISARVSGSGGWTSGNFYQVDPTNTQTNLTGFLLKSGTFFSGVDCSVNPFFVTAPGRLGIDLLGLSSGSSKLNIGVFGYST